MSISFKPSFGVLPLNATASGDMLVSGNLVVDGVLTAAGISGSGEANTASNVGGGEGVFKQKSGVDLEFKSLVGSGITINSKTSTIELTASGGGGSTNPGGSNTQVQFNQDGSFAGDSGFTYDGSGSLSFGSDASDTHQVTGTLSISGSQPLKVFGPQGTGGGASIIARHTSSIDDWETPISGALVVSADTWGEQPNGAVMYVHSQATAATIGFKNSSTLIDDEQKNQITSTKGAFVGLISSDLNVRNESGDVVVRADGTNEITVAGGGTSIGNASADFHRISGSLNISGSQVGLLHVRGDVTASNNISASAFYGDGSNLQNLPAGSSGGSNTQVQFNQNGSFAGDSGFTYDGSGSVSFGSAASDTHQVTGTLSISGSQPLKVFGPRSVDSQASIISTHSSSIGPWQSPISGALVVSADIGPEAGGIGNRGAAVMYIHSRQSEARLGFKNSNTLALSGDEQKNQVTSAGTGGAYVGLDGDQLDVRNEIGDILLRADANNEVIISNDGTTIGNNADDFHKISGSLNISGSQVGLLHVRGDVTASNNISASAFYGDGSNLQNLPAGSPGGSNTQIQFNQNGTLAGNNKLTYNGTGSLFISSSVTASVITGDKDISASNVELLINVTNQNAAGNEDYSGSLVITLPNDDTGGSKVDIRKYGSGSVAYINADGDIVGNGNAQFSNGQITAGNGFFGSSLDNESGDLTIRPAEDSKTLLKNISGSGGVRFDDKDDNIIGQITSGSTGGIDFDYYTGSISNVALIQNTYFSASINSNTSVPTNQYSFINYQVGASLALTASSPVAGASYAILLRQDATGGRVVSFDSATFKFPSGSNTTNSTGSGDVDIVTGISDGTVIYAAMSKKFV